MRDVISRQLFLVRINSVRSRVCRKYSVLRLDYAQLVLGVNRTGSTVETKLGRAVRDSAQKVEVSKAGNITFGHDAARPK